MAKKQKVNEVHKLRLSRVELALRTIQASDRKYVEVQVEFVPKLALPSEMILPTYLESHTRPSGNWSLEPLGRVTL